MDGDVTGNMKELNWKAGVAAKAITPAEPMWLAGWAARREPAKGKAMDLFAKALAFEDAEGQRAVIVTVDLIAIPRTLAASVAAKVHAQCRLPRERLLFNASHTHTGPEVRPDKVPFFEIPSEFAAKIEPYVRQLEQKLTGIIGEALGNLQPARLRALQTSVDFVQNRRTPGGPTDPVVPLLQMTSMRGQTIAIMFGLACHNLTLPPEFCQYHGDFAGVAQQLLEAEIPGAKVLFVAGAGADQNPFPRGTVELVRQHGESLAKAIRAALEAPTSSPANLPASLRSAFEEVALDFRPLPSIQTLEAALNSGDGPKQRKAKFLLNALAEKRSLPATYPCPVHVLNFGSGLLLIALGGEPPVDYALQFKSEFTGPLVWVAGYSNDGFGYLPNRRLAREGGYEGDRSLFWSELPGPFTDTVEERIVETVRALVAKVSPGISRKQNLASSSSSFSSSSSTNTGTENHA